MLGVFFYTLLFNEVGFISNLQIKKLRLIIGLLRVTLPPSSGDVNEICIYVSKPVCSQYCLFEGA